MKKAEGIDADDIVIPFQLESSNLRGRIVRMGGVLNDIVTPHGYSNLMSYMTGEVATLAILLSSMLKYEGIFTLQIQGDGPVSMMAADITTSGDVRACATYDRDAKLNNAKLTDLMGKGYLASTVDQGPETERYQGIVALEGGTLVECVQHYFTQSEQITTGIRMAVGRTPEGKWRAGAVMLQKLPEQGGESTNGATEEDWNRAMMLLNTCSDKELLSEAIHPHNMLIRLFHEEGVRIFDPTHLRKKCRCGEEKLRHILAMMPDEDIDDMIVDGVITMTCEFCNTHYKFDPEELRVRIKTDNQ